MNRWIKGIASALPAIFLLSRCLVPGALAEEGPEPPIALPAPAEPAQEPQAHGDQGPATAPAPGGQPEEPDWREASTLKELEDLLLGGMMQNGGQIRVTSDLLLPAGEFCRIWPSIPEGKRLVVDMGVHKLAVEGTLAVNAGIEFIGAGGEEGLIRVKPGGSASLFDVLFTVTEPGGYAVWQEEGGILRYTPHEDTVGEIRLAPGPEAEAASYAELAALLEDGNFLKTGGQIHATADLTVPAGTQCRIWPRNPEDAPLTVDLGEHTLFVEGGLTVHSGVEFTGAGGENGLVRVRTGGQAGIASSTRFTVAAEGGYALWQEEGGILDYEPAPGSTGSIHFAERPVAVPYSTANAATFTSVALVRDGQALADVLPAMDSVRLYHGGAKEDARIPVIWDLEACWAQLDGRERVLLTGSYLDAEAFQAPACLVAFQNGNPATILNCYGTEGRGAPSAMVQLALAQPGLDCRIEWSANGKNWMPAGSEESLEEGEFPVFYVTFPQEEPPAYPYYLSAVVEGPDGSVGYSDVAVIREANVQCGNGGNRGGGTDIIDPPDPPQPDPPEQDGDNETPDGAGDTLLPAAPGDGGGVEMLKPRPNRAPDPPIGAQGGVSAEQPAASTLSPDPPKGIQGVESGLRAALPGRPTDPPGVEAARTGLAGNGKEAPSGTERKPPSSPAVSAPEAPAAPGMVPANPDEGAPASEAEPEPPASSGGTVLPRTMDLKAAPNPAPSAPGALPIAVGCTAVAATVGAAGLYLHPKAGKRLKGALKRLFQK